MVELKKQQQGMDTLKQFWLWWSSELRQLSPHWLKNFFSKNTGTLSIHLEEGVARFQLSADKEQRLLGVADLESGTDQVLQELKNKSLADVPGGTIVDVYLPTEKLLVSQQLLPLATEDNLDNVLKFEIDRLTPFHPEQVSYGYQVINRYPENDKLQIELSVLPRETLSNLLSRLDILGLAPHGIWPTTAGDQNISASQSGKALPNKASPSNTPSQNLLPHDQRPVVESIWNGRAKQLGVVTLLLLLMVLVYPAVQFDRSIASVEQNIADVRQSAMVVGKKQSLLAARLMAQDTLVQRKNQSPGKLNIIHEVTKLLPDNTWVSRLKMDDQSINLQGESKKASDLIELLEKSDHFHNVVFVSPITRNSSTNMERYEIRMGLASADKGGAEK